MAAMAITSTRRAAGVRQPTEAKIPVQKWRREEKNVTNVISIVRWTTWVNRLYFLGLVQGYKKCEKSTHRFCLD